MRITPLLILVAAVAAGPEFGIWKMNPIRSIFAGDTQPRSLTIRIEPHPKGEVLTLDRIEVDGRAISSSSILYLDGRERDFHDGECSGTQLSRRIDSQTIEILRNLRDKCADQVRPADCAKEPTRSGDFGTTSRRPPLRPPAGIREAMKR